MKQIVHWAIRHTNACMICSVNKSIDSLRDHYIDHVNFDLMLPF